MLCQKCYGSGRIMGNGMMYEDCICQYEDEAKCCNESTKPIQIDKRTKAYREAITKIMDINQIDKQEAEKLFEEEFYKIA